MKRLLPFVVIIIVLVGLVVAPLMLFRPENYRKSLTDQLTRVFRHSVLIGKMDAHYFPPQLALDQVSVLKNAQERYLTIDHATLILGWGALLGRVAPPSDVQLSGVHAVINRLPSGGWDYSEWWPSSIGGRGPASSLPNLTIKNSDAVWIDVFAPTRAQIQMKTMEGQWQAGGSALSLTGELGGAVLPATFNFQAKGPVGAGDWTGQLKLTDGGRALDAQLHRQGTSWQIMGNSAEWRLDSAAALARFYLRLPSVAASAGSSFLRNWKTEFTTIGASSTFTHSAMIDGGSSEIKGTLQHEPAPHVTLSAAAQNIPIPSLKPLLGTLSDGLDGKLTGLVPHFDLSISSHALENAAGSFVFELADGNYRLPASSLQALKKVKTAKYLSKKFPEFSDKGFPFSKARFQGAVERDGVTLQQAGLVSGDVRAAFAGRLEFAQRSVDLWLELQLHEALPHLRKELPERYVVGEAGRQKILPIFGHMQGPWAEWKLRAASHSKVPAAIQKKLRSGLNI